MAKAQIQTQPILLILGLFLAIGILLLGYRGISAITASAQQAKITQFYDAIKKDVFLYKDFGSNSGVISYELPANHNKICFFQLEGIDPSSQPLCDPATGDKIACSYWKSKSTSVLLFPPTEESMVLSNLQVAGGAICINVRRSRINVVYEGKGTSTLITSVAAP